jgi:hypothetical protein
MRWPVVVDDRVSDTPQGLLTTRCRSCEDRDVRSRRLTELYLTAVERAAARPGEWTDVRVFNTKANADVTANCLAGGYLRADPREGDTPVRVAGKTYVATAAPVTTKITQEPDGWSLKIRVSGRTQQL